MMRKERERSAPLVLPAGRLTFVNLQRGPVLFGQFLVPFQPEVEQLQAAAEPLNQPLLRGRNYATLIERNAAHAW